MNKRIAASILATALAWSGAACAHPHVFITTQVSVLFENGSIVGLRHRWLFDEYYTSTAIEGLDTNKDGIYDRAELADLAQVTAEGLKDFDYFTQTKLAGQDLAYQAPKDYWFELTEIDNPALALDSAAPDSSAEQRGFWQRLWDWVTDWWSGSKAGAPPQPEATAKPAKINVLAFEFTLPLQQPVLAEAEGFKFVVHDSSVFIWFEPDKNDPVKLIGAPAGCAIKLAGSSADAQALGQAFGDQLGGGTTLANAGEGVTVTCPKP